MKSISILLTIVSFAVLALGMILWRKTGHRTVLLNTLFGSFSFLYAAYEASARNRPEWAFVLPFFVSMLFGGRALGAWWRSRKEAEYGEPARILFATACLTGVTTVAAWFYT